MRATYLLHVCLMSLLALFMPLARSSAAPVPPGAPRLLVLPWLVIDRNTNLDCAKLATSLPAIVAEAQRLAISGQAAMDNMMHSHGFLKMIPRKEWEPHWQELAPGQVVRQGPGCAVCTPAGQLIQFDRAALLGLAHGLQADYVLLGVTVVPMTPQSRDTRPDDCCRAALALERRVVLARSSALLVRIRDGEITWQSDARRLDRDVPRPVHRTTHQAEGRLDLAVRDTAHDLGKAFRRDCEEALR